MTLPLYGIVQLTGLSGASSTPTSALLSDHSRSALETSWEEIGSTKRTYNGTLRGFIIARKPTFSTSWSLLPTDARVLADYRSGNPVVLDALTLKKVYEANKNVVFTLNIYAHTNAVSLGSPLEGYLVRFKDFSSSIRYRNTYVNGVDKCDFWDANVVFEAV